MEWTDYPVSNARWTEYKRTTISDDGEGSLGRYSVTGGFWLDDENGDDAGRAVEAAVRERHPGNTIQGDHESSCSYFYFATVEDAKQAIDLMIEQGRIKKSAQATRGIERQLPVRITLADGTHADLVLDTNITVKGRIQRPDSMTDEQYYEAMDALDAHVQSALETA